MSRYDDIIGLPHHRSLSHKPLSKEQRAAQFAPFSALEGKGDEHNNGGGHNDGGEGDNEGGDEDNGCPP